MNLKTNNPMPLELQLHDGAEDKFVKVWLWKPDKSLFCTVILDHLSSGLYVNSATLMPNLEFVTAQYKVYEDSGFTELGDYSTECQIFSREYSNIAGDTLEGTFSTDEILTGIIEE